MKFSLPELKLTSPKQGRNVSEELPQANQTEKPERPKSQVFCTKETHW